MNQMIKNILTDVNSRSDSQVEATLNQRASTGAPWWSAEA